MKASFTRRDWFKSTLALTSGMVITPALVNSLMAAPVSEAERVHGIIAKGTNKMVRLGSNENPYGPSAKARKAVQEAMDEYNRYPFTAAAELKAMIAAKEGVSTDNILMGAGSGELLCLAGATTGLENGAVLSAFPTFRLLMDYAAKFNARWDKVNLDQYHVHNLEAMASAVKPDTKLMFVCNPNNPTGTVLNADKLKSFCIEMAKKTTVYMDEAYIELLEPAEQISMVELVKKGHNVIVSRTFSKVYGLAGLRIGYVIGPVDKIKKMANIQMSYQNQAALAAAKAALHDEEFAAYTRQKNREALNYFSSYLDSKKWFHGKSYTNCVLFPAPKDGKTILAETEARGFQIRIWDYENREWCRVSIGTLDEMKAFTKAFDEVVG